MSQQLYCPDAGAKWMQYLRRNHRELWEELLRLEEVPGTVGNVWSTWNGLSIHDMKEWLF